MLDYGFYTYKKEPFIEKGIIKYLADEKTGETKLVWADGTPFIQEPVNTYHGTTFVGESQK